MNAELIDYRKCSIRIADKRKTMPWLSGKKLDELASLMPLTTVVVDRIQRAIKSKSNIEPIEVRVNKNIWTSLEKKAKRKSNYKASVNYLEVIFKGHFIAVILRG